MKFFHTPAFLSFLSFLSLHFSTSSHLSLSHSFPPICRHQSKYSSPLNTNFLSTLLRKTLTADHYFRVQISTLTSTAVKSSPLWLLESPRVCTPISWHLFFSHPLFFSSLLPSYQPISNASYSSALATAFADSLAWLVNTNDNSDRLPLHPSPALQLNYIHHEYRTRRWPGTNFEPYPQ